jgi:hypothetical protein
MDVRYRVDIYDAFDGWGLSGLPPGTDPSNEYDDLEKAKESCIEKMKKSGLPNSMGEHYGVIDLTTRREVFCGKEWAKLKGN